MKRCFVFPIAVLALVLMTVTSSDACFGRLRARLARNRRARVACVSRRPAYVVSSVRRPPAASGVTRPQQSNGETQGTIGPRVPNDDELAKLKATGKGETGKEETKPKAKPETGNDPSARHDGHAPARTEALPVVSGSPGASAKPEPVNVPSTQRGEQAPARTQALPILPGSPSASAKPESGNGPSARQGEQAPARTEVLPVLPGSSGPPAKSEKSSVSDIRSLRPWTNAAGDRQVRAVLALVLGEYAYFQTEGGKLVTTKVTSLSANDQKLIRDWSAQQASLAVNW